jgi:hypothetical protein
MTIKTSVTFKGSVLTSLALLLSCGCGADPESGDSVPTESTQQAIGELNCAFTAPDFNCGTGTWSPCEHASLSSTYDHSTCRHAWIGQIQFTAGHPGLIVADYDTLYGGAPLADGTVFPCNGMWVRSIVMQFKNNLWTQFSDRTALGSTISGHCAAPFISQVVPPGTYKVLSQAGFATAYEPVLISMMND